MKATIRDVANKAGVSTATVSHVINNTRFVSDAIKKKVLDSIAELGYSPNAVARIFKTGRKNLIGCVIPDISNSFFSTIINEAEEIVSNHGYRMIVVNTREQEIREVEHLQILSSGIVDGLILASTIADSRRLAELIPSTLPTVLFDRVLSNGYWDSVTISDYDAMYQGVEVLINDGHKKIGYITGLNRLSTTQERLRAYKDAMAAHALLLSKEQIQQGDSMSQSAVMHLEPLLAMGCTAIVVSNNVMADDALFYLSDKDLKIGQDISILGYDDSYKTTFNQRRMHMVSQPTNQLGKKVGEQIVERIKFPDAPVKNILLNSAFVKKLRTY